MMCTRVCDSLKISYYCSPKTSYTTVLLLPPPRRRSHKPSIEAVAQILRAAAIAAARQPASFCRSSKKRRWRGHKLAS